MNLQSLIKTLESAAELATDGEWTADDGVISYGPCVRGRTHSEGHAQAIAIRHNTASMVLSELKKLSHVLECEETNGMLDAFLHSVDMKNADAKRFESELKTQRARADRLEVRVRELEADTSDPSILMPIPVRKRIEGVLADLKWRLDLHCDMHARDSVTWLIDKLAPTAKDHTP